MKINAEKNNFSSKGLVYYANKTAREAAPKYREIIHNLKHHTANKDLSHYIYINKFQDEKGFSMNIVTKYKHPQKVDGYDEHIYETVYCGNNFQKAKEYFVSEIKKINPWKREIDLVSHQEAEALSKEEKLSLWDKFKAFFVK